MKHTTPTARAEGISARILPTSLGLFATLAPPSFPSTSCYAAPLFTGVLGRLILRSSAVVGIPRKPAPTAVVLLGVAHRPARRLTSSTMVGGDATLCSTASAPAFITSSS